MPTPAPCTTWPHQAPSGLLDGLDPSGWIADKGYVGRGMITPHKKPPNGELSEAAQEANKSVNQIRQVVEQTIAHIKAWRIHPHRLPPPPARIRTDHHRRTLTLRIQNHPLNKLPGEKGSMSAFRRFRVSFPPVSRAFSAGFGEEGGDGRGQPAAPASTGSGRGRRGRPGAGAAHSGGRRRGAR
ncbi:transposase family protein [Actinomyces sp. oral taxon 897]|uniref:transposase family protein n=1 Tax=Actinomyces sp. oral taxon 897 TaxID=2081702 RepID=UPI0034A039A1